MVERTVVLPHEVQLPKHTPLCRNLFCNGECLPEMMTRNRREYRQRAQRARAYIKLMRK